MLFHILPIRNLINELMKLPGIGEKTATRLAYFIIKMPKEESYKIANSIIEAKEKIKLCSICFNFTDNDPCEICTSSFRNNELICVVEEPSDVNAIERLSEYKGKYHVLHGTLSPLEGRGPDDLKINELISRIKKENIKEIILATNLTTEGNTTALYLVKLLKNFPIKLTRIAQGVPVGGDLKYADKITLKAAIDGRREI